MEITNSQFINSLLSVMKFNFRGEYSETEEYHFFDLVSNNGSSYCAKTTSIGQSLLDTDYWQLIAAIGEPGEQGVKGETGVSGEAGQSAYAAAQTGGYVGTETAFYADLSAISGLAAELEGLL